MSNDRSPCSSQAHGGHAPRTYYPSFWPSPYICNGVRKSVCEQIRSHWYDKVGPINQHQRLITFSSSICISKYSCFSLPWASLQQYSFFSSFSCTTSFVFPHTIASPFPSSSLHFCTSLVSFPSSYTLNSSIIIGLPHAAAPTASCVFCSIFPLPKACFCSSLLNNSLCSSLRCFSSSNNLVSSTSIS